MHIKRYLKKPALIIPYLGKYGWFRWMSDEAYIKMVYRIHFGVYPDLEHPKTYNEKLNWLKLHDRQPQYTDIVDKYTVKKYISGIIGEEYVVPTLGVWDRFEDIDFDALPNQFVLKCTHDSGGLVICRDKSKLNKAKARRKINSSLKRNYYWTAREWPYKNVKPRIIAEPYLEDTRYGELRDYKFYVFDGTVDSVMVCKDRQKGRTKYYYFDRNWNRLYYQWDDLEFQDDIERPEHFDEMLDIAQRLSRSFSHIRVDLYNVDGSIYFSELTLYDEAGFGTDISGETNRMWGEKLDERRGSAVQEAAVCPVLQQ